VKSIGIFEGKTHFSRLVEEAERGETIVVTRHGKAVAELGPVRRRQLTADEAIERLLSRKVRLGCSIAELRDEGRRG